MEEFAPIGLLIPPPLPPFPPSASHGIELSPLEFVLGLIAVITIPFLVYTFIFAIRCPSPAPTRRARRGGGGFSGEAARAAYDGPTPAPAPAATESKLRKEAEGECPVCLSAFGEGEEVRQLTACSHSFHSPCIDAWLSSHASCPVCRASIAVKRPPPSSNRPTGGGDPDHLQGLPDASSLV